MMHRYRVISQVCLWFFLVYGGICQADGTPVDRIGDLVGPPKTRAEAIRQKMAVTGELMQAEEALVSLQSELRGWNAELDWLEEKCLRMMDADRTLPESLVLSSERKKKRIAQLSKELARMTVKRDAAAASLRRLVREVEERFGAPSWWWISPDVSAVAGISDKQPGSVTGSSPAGAAGDANAGLVSEIKALGLDTWVELVRRDGVTLLETRLPILFSSGKTGISKEYHKYFKPLAAVLSKYAREIRVTGYTDPRQIHSRLYPSNFELGARRAATVMHLLAKYGVSPSRCVISSYGPFGMSAQERPDANGGMAIRRRVVISAVIAGTVS
ncbi:MAG: hypothetical protein CSA22_04125 [Deltaproteobacteria bacterium]|nr:MAG: hypothetical protein CSA22_04125 [Deltaproteobacteria bacterium]